MDVTKIPPDTIVTEEMLDPQQGERFMVIEHDGKCNEVIRESTEIEIKAYRAYQKIKHKDKILIKAMVTYSNLPKQLGYDEEFILSHETLEVIEKGN